MIDALRYEWVRIRTIRSTWWLSGVVVTVGVGIAFLASWGFSESLQQGQVPDSSERALVAPAVTTQFAGEGAPFIIAFVAAMLGVFAWGHEYRHGMIRATLTALPSRTHAWAAKFLVVAAWVAVAMAVTFLLSAVVGWLWLGDDGFAFATSDVATSALRAGVYTLLLAWAAGAFTALVRHQTAALVLMFLWPLAIENVLTVVVNVVPALDAVAPLARFLPFNAAARMLRYGDTGGTLWGDPLSPWGGFLVFAAFTGVLMAASLALLHRRDA